MKPIFATAAFALFATGIAMGADVITFPSKKGNVTFKHKEHQEQLKDCKQCHENGPGKIKGFGKEWAHKNCKGCHQDMGDGPIACGGCHKK